ncbi:hypothetical protein D3C72_796120 [compost metagenome]
MKAGFGFVITAGWPKATGEPVFSVMIWLLRSSMMNTARRLPATSRPVLTLAGSVKV